MTMIGRREALAASTAALLAGAHPAGAQAPFPSRNIRLLIGAAPGGAPDVAARLMAERLSATWRQPVVADNRPAGNGSLAAQALAGAEADGHALLYAHASILVLNEALMRSPGYNSERDFAPVTLLMTTPFVITARPGLPANTLPELIALARARPGQMTFATSSATNLPRFAGELLKRVAGIDMVNVPYASAPAAVQDTIAGRVDLTIDGTPALIPQVRSGLLKAIALTSATRFPGLEEIPVVAESFPGFASVGWFGVVAPRATPAPLVERIAGDFRDVLAVPEMRARLLRDFGAQVEADGPAAFAAFLDRERSTYRNLIRELGVPID
jgi:tripartite-type tricarboxylate transporter receptor subunit TctC